MPDIKDAIDASAVVADPDVETHVLWSLDTEANEMVQIPLSSIDTSGPGGGGPVGGEGDAATLQGQAAAYYRSRSNHTGSQTVSTISDFNSAVTALINAVIDGAPGALDTLNELAAALGDDPNFATTVAAALAARAQKAATESITGAWDFVVAPTGPTPEEDEELATKGYVDAVSLRLLALYFNGDPMTVDVGNFYPEMDVPLGDCIYETWIKLDGVDTTRYDWSAGYGGAHAMLRNPYAGNFRKAAEIVGATNASPIVIETDEPHGFSSGTIAFIRGVEGNTAANAESPTIVVSDSTHFSITGSSGNGAYTEGGIAYNNETVAFGADSAPYVGQWAHSATGVDMYAGLVVQYYDGIPVGMKKFVGERICANTGAGDRRGFMGGSDHNNLEAWIAQYRIFEGANYRAGVVLNPTIQLSAFAPQTGFSGQIKPQGGDYFDLISCQWLVSLFNPDNIITDKSEGWPKGTNHPGRIRGSGLSIFDERSTYPGPRFVPDPDVPNSVGGSAPVQPAGRAYSPAAAPGGALVSDSIERKNSTMSWDSFGGLGSTESGSLGALPWLYHDTYDDADDIKPFGILNEMFVPLRDGLETSARVAIPQTNLEIQVSRRASDSWGEGISTGIMFRYVNDTNFCFACTGGFHYEDPWDWTRSGQLLYIGQVVAGAVSHWTGNRTALPSSWTKLIAKTKSNGDYEILADATSVVSGNNSQHASGTGAGIALFGDPQYYGHGRFGAALRFRVTQFDVFANP